MVTSAPNNRRCGGCQLCCRLTPVQEIHKAAGERCRHQRVGKGCMIYDKRPFSCRMWSCRWLVEDDTADLSRPDRSHYVVDIMPDYVTARNNETGAEQHCQAVQVWVDPRYPDAHRDPALRAYLLRRGAEGIVAIIRYSSDEGFVLCPPNMASDGKWHEEKGQMTREASLHETAAALGGKIKIVMSEQ